MSGHGKFGLFVLTPEEQRAIAFLVLALILGLWTKHYRATHPRSSSRPNEPAAAIASATPSPIRTP
ncbi:MAG TPA: hypothetical protein VH207_11545 [Chthoniobacterales bacterium]|nr:hypothetical protein [Chthoniobacterales bacterium]